MLELTFDVDSRVNFIKPVVQCHLHHVQFAPAKFEFATPVGLGGDAFTKEIRHLTSDLDHGFNVTSNVVEYALHYVTNVPAKFTLHYALHCVTNVPAKFEVAMPVGLGEDAFTKEIHHLTSDLDHGSDVTSNVVEYALHYVTNVPAKVEVATSNSLRGNAFTS